MTNQKNSFMDITSILWLLLPCLIIGLFIVAMTGAFGVYDNDNLETIPLEDYYSARNPESSPYSN